MVDPVRVREERRGVQTDQGAGEGDARLTRLLAEKELAIDILNQVAKGKF